MLTVVGLVLLLFCLWVWIGVRIGIWTYPQYQRHIWLVETVPVAQALWSHQINAGDNAYALIHEWNPDQIIRFGRWIEMRWFPGGPADDGISFIGVYVMGKDSALVAASAYSDDGLNSRRFFDTLTTNDESEFRSDDEEYVKRMVAGRDLVPHLQVLDELSHGNIKSGDKVEDIIKKWPPRMVTRFGDWMILRWFPDDPAPASEQVFGVRMIAKDGVIVHANSFSDDGHRSTFIDAEAPLDKEDFESAYQSAVVERLQIRNISAAIGTNNIR